MAFSNSSVLLPPYSASPGSNVITETRSCAPTQDGIWSRPQEMTPQIRLLRRFILEVLAFTYEIDLNNLKQELSTTSLASETGPSEFKWPSILSDNERVQIQKLSEAIYNTREYTRRQEHSLLLYSERTLIHFSMLSPAISMKLWPGYVAHQLDRYRFHQCNPSKRHKTAPYAVGGRILGFTSFYRCNQTILAQRLMSDETELMKIAPTEEVRVLIGRGIAGFRRRYCRVVLKQWNTGVWNPAEYNEFARDCEKFAKDRGLE